MEHAYSLIVLTLLQLCLAEIPNAAPRWYAVNLINDSNYSPKPITEIFSQNTFPPDNQVIVLQSTQSPITQDILGTTPPTTWSTGPANTQSTSYTQTQFPRIFSDQNIQSSTQDPSTQLTQSTIPYQTTNLRADLTSILGNYQTSQTQSYSPFQTTPPTVAVTPSTVQTWLPTQSTTPPPLPTSDFTTLSTTPPPIPLDRQTYSTLPPYVPTIRSNNNIPFNQQQGQAIGRARPCDLNGVRPNTIYNASSPTLLSPIPKPVLTIRLKAPRGSITNLHINPSTTTTTKRPTTTRRRKSPKGRNDYEICLDSCKGRKDPICASPLGVFPIDSNTLKGFPSLCHMACHNSFRKQQSYDKVADGRCGRLRTRIRTVEKNKIKREDLNKAQYTVSHAGPETVVEFSSLKR